MMYTKSELKEVKDTSFDKGFYIGLTIGMILSGLLLLVFNQINAQP